MVIFKFSEDVQPGLFQRRVRSVPHLKYSKYRRSNAEVERYIYSQLPVTYRLDQITQSKLLIRWVGGDRGSNLQPLDCEANALPTELTGHNPYKSLYPSIFAYLNSLLSVKQ